MLKIVVFDCGYGGEFFADRLKEELPLAEIIRVIDWRNADKYMGGPKEARRTAEDALRPYFGEVDLIILANHFLSSSSIKFFRHRYKQQKFVGLELKYPDTFVKRDVLILTTKALAKTLNYRNFTMRLKRKFKTVTLDTWPEKIDDGELGENEIKQTLEKFFANKNFNPEEIILACSQFNDIKESLLKLFGRKIRIYDSFDDTLREAFKILKIRGGIGKKVNYPKSSL